MQTTNRLTLIGHVATLKAFAKVTKVTIVTNRTWMADGERKSAASHVPVSVLDQRQAQWVAESVGVGDLVHLEARVEEGSYGEDQATKHVVNVIAEEFNLLKRRGSDDVARLAVA